MNDVEQRFKCLTTMQNQFGLKKDASWENILDDEEGDLDMEKFNTLFTWVFRKFKQNALKASDLSAIFDFLQESHTDTFSGSSSSSGDGEQKIHDRIKAQEVIN